MMKDYFNRYAPFIQEYIFKECWQELRYVQQEAAQAIFETNKNVLIATPTASGKTEAAIFPILTLMKEFPEENIQTLYVSPLKALINDQFVRLETVLENSGISVFKWHGDVNNYDKQKALRTNNIILQITPESLESLFINHYDDLSTIFKNLKYIIIDEVHYFVSNVRGIHLMSLLTRLERLISHPIRKIGLSATIGNPIEVAKFLTNSKNASNNTIIIKNRQEKTKINLQMVYNQIDSEADIDRYYHNIYNLINNRRTIIFANSKQKVEETAQYLNLINKENHSRNYILVHHGNISKALRTEVENKMRSGENAITAVATMTLELGIDLGRLERVIQIDVPPSISSFVQRLGRTGRKTKIQEMAFLFSSSSVNSSTSFYESINWQFLLSIAMVDLYLKEKYIEPISSGNLPYGVLLHQTISFLANNPGVKANVLAREMLTIPVFSSITKDDYRLLLQTALSSELLEKNANGEIYIGKIGEKILNNYEFYAVFSGSDDYEVFYKTKLIGSITRLMPIGSVFSLAGQTWEVEVINKKKRKIEVKPSSNLATTSWNGSGIIMYDTRLMKNLKRVLDNKIEIPYANLLSKSKYQEFVDIYQNLPLLKSENYDMYELNPTEYLILPFLGTKEFLTFYYILKDKYINTIFYFDHFIPLFIIVKGVRVKSDLIDIIDDIKQGKYNLNDIKTYETFMDEDKFQKFIPSELVEKSYRQRIIKLEELRDNL